MRIPILPAAALLLAACSTPGTGEPPPAAPPKEETAKAADPAAKPDAPPPGIPAPAVLAEGDRWFVAVRAGAGPEPVAERSRRTRGEGFVREEVTWGRSFADLAAAGHGTAQVFALILDGRGLSVSGLDEKNRLFGETGLEVAAPFLGGTTWTADVQGRTVDGRIVGMERVETPGGPVDALRVDVSARNMVSRIWYDAGLRPVRAEIRRDATEIVEARAALASERPTPEECRAAVEWAKKHLPAPGK